MSSPVPDRTKILLLSLVVLSGLILYLPSLKISFLNDEIAFISRNKAADFSELISLFDKKDYDGDYYRPIPNFISGLITPIFDFKSVYYRLFNVILHTGNAVLVFFFTLLLLRGKPNNSVTALFSSLLFIAFPLNDYPVIWHTDLFDRVMFFFYLLSILFYLKKESAGILSLLFFILALLSKEMAFSLPVVILFLSYYITKNKKNALKDFVIYLAAALTLVAFRWTAFGNNIFMLNDAHSGTGILLAAENIVFFGGMLLFPFFLRQIQELLHNNPALIIIPIVIASTALVWFVGLKKKADPLIIILFLIILITILPASRLLMRWYLYLPSAFYCILLSVLIFNTGLNIRKAIYAAVIFFSVCYASVLFSESEWINVSSEGYSAVVNFRNDYGGVNGKKELVFLTIPAKVDDIPLFQLGFDHHLRYYLHTDNRITVCSKSVLEDLNDRIDTSTFGGGVTLLHTGDNYFMLSGLEKSIKFNNRDLVRGKIKKIYYPLMEESDKLIFTFSEGKFHLIKENK